MFSGRLLRPQWFSMASGKPTASARGTMRRSAETARASLPRSLSTRDGRRTRTA